jgi:hypothetical protein
MKWKIKLWAGGRIFIEEVIASNAKQAAETSKVRNPFAKIISVNVCFK